MKICLNIVLALVALVSSVFYRATDIILIKAIASLSFVAMGFVNFVFISKQKHQNKKFACYMLSGLFLSMLGDVFLELNFVLGTLVFLLGHFCYLFAYGRLKKFQTKDFFFAAIIALVSLAFIEFIPTLVFESVLIKSVCILYSLVISAMLGKAISNFIGNKNKLNLVLITGSTLFYFSDLMLVINVFGGGSAIFTTLCLSTYYPAQCLLAYAISMVDEG